tara:strand:- start:6030 stop:7058 length:1029 start_codon:yes stop_codon:yes gene_type:complete
MKTAQLRCYGDSSCFEILDTESKIILGPKELLISIKATSINPIDVMKREGYGKSIFEKQRKILFPWVLGTDLAGVVLEIGERVTRFKVGQQVWGSSTNPNRGTYSDLGSFHEDELDLKPDILSFEEAASLPYAAITTWSALVRWAGLRPVDLKGKKVFIQAGSGGVGTYAVQLFKHLGCYVSTNCSHKNIELLYSLGADEVINYEETKFQDILSEYDIFYDLLGGDQEENCISILKKNSESHFITLVHPFMATLDTKGLLLGLPSAISKRQKLKNKYRPINYHWAIYRPSLSALKELTRMVQIGIIKPVISKVYGLEEISAAHDNVETGHASGKIIINMESS